MTKIVKILGVDVTVIYENRELSGNANSMGRSCTKTGKIWIDCTMSAQIQRETLLHEILEYIIAQCDMDVNHIQLSTLSACLHQVLEDNALGM